MNFIGYNIIKKNTDKGILVEMWQDTGDSKNPWKLVKSWTEKPHWKVLHERGEAPSDHIDPPLMIGSNEDRLRAQGKLPPTEWDKKMEYFKTLNYNYEEDQKKALKEGIKCEHPGCEWIAESRCIECLMSKMGDHWFCRPMVFYERYYGPYLFSFEKGTPYIVYNNDHAHEHERQVHPPKEGMYKWKSVKELSDDEYSDKIGGKHHSDGGHGI